MYMLQECRRLLQRGDQILLDAPDLSRDDARAVDVLAFTAAASSTSAAQPAVAAPSSSGSRDSAEQPVAQEPDMDEEEVVEGGSAAEAPNDEAALPAQHFEPPPGPSPFIDTSVREAGENPDDNLTTTIEVTTLTNTTSVYDDWLHRGPFLADLDLHTYVTYVLRSPRPVKARLADTERVEHVFAFDDHYELAKSHWQQLKTQGQTTLPMLVALRCSPPDMNNGEDNTMYKTLMGTLLTCPGQSRCNDPLLYRPAFFPPTDPTTFNCRQQWKARRAEIELLAVRAEEKSNAAKRIPVLADTTLCRTHSPGTGSAPPLELLYCRAQWWIQQCGRALPCFAPRILAFLNMSLHNEHQLTVAEFSAYHLRSVIQHLDGLAIARTTKLTTGCKEHAEDELLEAPSTDIHTPSRRNSMAARASTRTSPRTRWSTPQNAPHHFSEL